MSPWATIIINQIISFDISYLSRILMFHIYFMFQFNYGGIQAKTLDADCADGDNDIDIVSSWNIAECLPKATQVIQLLPFV